MSLVTRCPACGTHFKVVRDQLRISDGWVRCGRCSQVFDAALDLRETPDGVAPVPAPAKPPQDEPAGPAPEGDSSTADAASSRSPALNWPGRDLLDLARPRAVYGLSAGTDLPLYGLIADEPWPAPAPPAAASHAAVPNPPAPDAANAAPPWCPSVPRGAPAVDIQVQKALRRAGVKAEKIALARAKKNAIAAPVAPKPPAEPAAEVKPAPPLPSFLESSASRWRWREGRAAMRPRALMTIAMLAALLLVLQVLRHERDVLAARQPGLQPLLAQLCGVTGCKLAALRRIGSITIDGAAFARERSGDGYRLSFTLRNDAAIPLAMPAIELSLLDTQERAVVRRVLLPADFGAPPVLGANAERAASLALALSGAEVAALPPVAGYRVVAFYP